MLFECHTSLELANHCAGSAAAVGDCFESARGSKPENRAVVITLRELRRRFLTPSPRTTSSFAHPSRIPFCDIGKLAPVSPAVPRSSYERTSLFTSQLRTVSETCDVRPERCQTPYPCLSPTHCPSTPIPGFSKAGGRREDGKGCPAGFQEARTCCAERGCSRRRHDQPRHWWSSSSSGGDG